MRIVLQVYSLHCPWQAIYVPAFVEIGVGGSCLLEASLLHLVAQATNTWYFSIILPCYFIAPNILHAAMYDGDCGEQSKVSCLDFDACVAPCCVVATAFSLRCLIAAVNAHFCLLMDKQVFCAVFMVSQKAPRRQVHSYHKLDRWELLWLLVHACAQLHSESHLDCKLEITQGHVDVIPVLSDAAATFRKQAVVAM